LQPSGEFGRPSQLLFQLRDPLILLSDRLRQLVDSPLQTRDTFTKSDFPVRERVLPIERARLQSICVSTD